MQNCSHIQRECRDRVVGFYEKAIARSGVRVVSREETGFYANGDKRTLFSLLHHLINDYLLRMSAIG